MSELVESVMPDELEAPSIDGANDRFSIIRAQEGGAILRRYNASIAAVAAGLERVPVRYRDTTTAAVRAYMKVAHDTWSKMRECDKDFGVARRLQFDAQMRFAQSSKSLLSEKGKSGLLARIFPHKPKSQSIEQNRDSTMESVSVLRSAIDQQTDSLMKYQFLQGEFERTLNEMAQIVQQHMVNGREAGAGRAPTGIEAKDPGESLSSLSVDNHSGRTSRTRKSRLPTH